MLYKRGTTWWTEFVYKGQRIRQSTGQSNKKTAEKEASKIKQEVKAELTGRKKQSAIRTYDEALLKWINSGAPKSMHSHARNTRPYLDDKPLDDLFPSEVEDMKGDMQQRALSNQPINRRLAVVKRVLNLSLKWGWINQPLSQNIEMCSEKGMAREIYLSREEFDRLIDLVEHPEVKKIICLAAYTGLRQGELARLTSENWKAPYIVLSNKTKSGRPRSVPVVAELHDMITLPFSVSYAQVRYWFEKAREKMGRPEIRMHDLRHTFASWMLTNPDIALTTVRDLMGHSSLAVTSKYAHMRSDTFEAVSRTLSPHKAPHRASVTH